MNKLNSAIARGLVVATIIMCLQWAHLFPMCPWQFTVFVSMAIAAFRVSKEK